MKNLHRVVQVPRVEERLATVAARHEAVATLREAWRTLAAHRAAAEEVRASGTLAAALALALAAGNVLNHGTRLGRAAGFRLRSLARLQVQNSKPYMCTHLRLRLAEPFSWRGGQCGIGTALPGACCQCLTSACRSVVKRHRFY